MFVLADPASAMEHTPTGTPVGVDDPYEHAGRCDHATADGRCRFAFENPLRDPAFTADRRSDDFLCPVSDESWSWQDCPHYRSRSSRGECARCGLEERLSPGESRPLLEEHHLSYPDAPTTHEITVTLCRWCHAKIHHSWARISDDVRPDADAIAAFENRRSDELSELEFTTAKTRRPDNNRTG